MGHMHYVHMHAHGLRLADYMVSLPFDFTHIFQDHIIGIVIIAMKPLFKYQYIIADDKTYMF